MKLQFAKPINNHWPSLAGNPVMPNPATNLIGPAETSYAVVAGDLGRSVKTGEMLSEVKPNRRTNRQSQSICGKATGYNGSRRFAAL